MLEKDLEWSGGKGVSGERLGDNGGPSVGESGAGLGTHAVSMSKAPKALHYLINGLAAGREGF